jgi:hypothetical protein
MKRHAAVLGKGFRENFVGAGRTDVGGDGISLFDHKEVEPRGSTLDHGEPFGFREPLLPQWSFSPENAYDLPSR